MSVKDEIGMESEGESGDEQAKAMMVIEAEVHGELSRASRTRKLTKKGQEYQIERKEHELKQNFKILTKYSEDVKILMTGDVKLDIMRKRYSEWMTLYEEFLQSHSDYCLLLSQDLLKKYMTDYFEPRSELLQTFKATIQDWFINVPRNPQVKSAGSIISRTSSNKTHVSTGSHRTSVLSSIASARIKEAQKKAELSTRQAALKAKQRLELAKFQLQQQEDELNLNTELAVATAKTKVLDVLEEVVFDEDASVTHHSKPLSRPHQSTVVHVDDDIMAIGVETLDIYHMENSVPVLGATSVVNIGRNHTENSMPVLGAQDNHSIRGSDISASSKSSDNILLAVTRQLKRPPTEIKKFGGNPLDYKKFLRQFQARVVVNTENNEERMNYLEQFTEDEAHRIVNGYSCLDADQGYPAALQELERRYGDVDVIAHAYVKKALDWPAIKPDNAKSLDGYSIFLVECENAVNCLEAVRVLEYSENMKMLVQKLPYFLHDKWRNIVLDTKDRSNIVTFAQLVQFVRREAKKANDPIYGKDAMYNRDHAAKPGAQKPASRRPKGSFATEVTEVKQDEKQAKLQVNQRETHNKSMESPTDSSVTHLSKYSAFNKPCMHCDKSSHSLDRCKSFEALLFNDRLNFLRPKGLCFSCLKPGHHSKICRYRATCEHCQKRHPTVLHIRDGNRTTSTNSVCVTNNDSNHISASVHLESDLGCHMGAGESNCTMPIIPVMVKMKNGLKAIKTYAFLDNGSNVSFCTENLKQQLGASGKQMKIKMNTIGLPYTMNTYVVKGLEVCDLSGDNTVELPRVYTKDKMPVTKDHIPTYRDISKWPHLQNLEMPQLDAEVSLLIGNNVPDAYSPSEVRTGPHNSPHATKTRLGWVVWNVIRDIDTNSEHMNTTDFTVNRAEVTAIQDIEQLERLDQLYRQSVNLDFPERVIDDKRECSQEDKLFIEMVNSSIQLVDGHYQISLPFRSVDTKMPDNSAQAMQRLRSLERKMLKDPKFYQDYSDFMASVISSGYAEKVPDEELHRDDGRVWFIPHHGVYHPKKPTKIRVVFDCAAITKGISLNKMLLQGPDLTNNLLGVLLRFRQEKIALMSDIEGMFHQVRVPKDECDYLRFYWWPEGNLTNEPEVYRMVVHLFGAVSSPSCANSALHQTANDNKSQFDGEVIQTILDNFYVDDCLKSVGTEQQAIGLVHDLSALCLKGGFRLTKWISNSRHVIQSVPVQERAKEIKDLDIDCEKLPIERALGVCWVVETDTMGFRISISSRSPTRRGILSLVSSVYDPLGFAAPFVLPAKILLQDLCWRGVGWDDEITGCDLQLWQNWLMNLAKLEKLTVQRCFKPLEFGEVSRCELHHFTDASEQGYGIVSYLRLIDVNGQIHCAFILAKSRVAPLKKISTPRMELTAATVAVRLNKKIQDELDFPVDDVSFWTDSMAVIRYIANENARFHTFVANRVAVIREGSEVYQWRYVASSANPADDASRGLSAENLLCNTHWFHGPEFLWKPESEWPKSPDTLHVNLISDSDPEVKKQVHVAIADESVNIMDRLLFYHSDWMKLKKTSGWILVAIRNLRSWAAQRKELSQKLVGVEPDPGKREQMVEQKMRVIKFTAMSESKKRIKSVFLSMDILDNAEKALICYVQRQNFREEIEALQSNTQIKKSSSLKRLDPIMSDGLLRVGGRLARANIPFDAKHQIVLPHHSVVSKLILEEAHRSVGHLGKDTMLAVLRQKYWILHACSSIRQILKKCVTCRKYNVPGGQQKMADLPVDRITPDQPPFTSVGMDFFGPIEVKRGRSAIKRYGVIFTCLATRSVHLEIAYSMNTDSCINAIRRFIARRGNVQHIRSDNGTNLVGAEREMREEILKWNSSKIGEALRQSHIKWDFNPPAASHFGGVWERLIRSVRKVLYSLLQEQVIHLDDEALQTLFCEVEAILNGRPITRMSNDPNDLEALTPNHLLLLHCGKGLPIGVFDKSDNYVRRRWRQVQYIADIFWKRWIKEYLPALQVRQKWFQPRRNVSVGDIVLIMDNAPRNSWSLGRVLSVITDRKGFVRFVKVKTSTTTLERPIDKLCLILEADMDC